MRIPVWLRLPLQRVRLFEFPVWFRLPFEFPVWLRLPFAYFCRSLTLLHAFAKLFGVFNALFLGLIKYNWSRHGSRCFICFGVATIAFSCSRLRNWWKFRAINVLCCIALLRGMIAATASLARLGSGIVGIVAFGLAMASNF